MKNIGKYWVQITAVIAALWALFTFLYKDSGLVKEYNGGFDVKADFLKYRDIKIKSGIVVKPVKIILSCQNKRNETVRVNAAYVEVWGDKLNSEKRFGYDRALIQKVLGEDGHDEYFGELDIQKKSILILISKVFAAWAFRPGETHRQEFMIYVPDKAVDAVEVDVYMVVGGYGKVINVFPYVGRDSDIEFAIKEGGDTIRVNDDRYFELMRKSNSGRIKVNFFEII